MSVELRRLRWRCRRGMRELDVLMTRYLEQHYAGASETEQAAFRHLLDLPDPELLGYLTGRLTADDPDLAQVLARISAPA